MQPRPDTYYERYSFCDAEIATLPQPDLGLVVTIPCFNEPDLTGCLESLRICDRPKCAVEVIVVINSPIGCDSRICAENARAFKEASEFKDRHPDPRLDFHILNFPNLPRKHAGVGLARKIAMDEAARRFDAVGKPGGIVVGYDADCRCDANYLTALEEHFRKHPRSPGCSIYFEHPLEGSLEPMVYEAIAAYELHLRFYLRALRQAGFPHAYHTIGSSMAVRANVYKKQGGMNKREAGEDFYFLQKVIPLGGFTDLTETRVIPSPRPSDRVPFGTGKAVLTFLQEQKSMTYPLEAFLDLKAFFDKVPALYASGGDPDPSVLDGLSEAMQSFLKKQNLEKSLAEVRKNTSNEAAFRNRFFRWFNAFMAMKFVHHARDKYYGEREISKEAARLLANRPGAGEPSAKASTRELLQIYRALDRSAPGPGTPSA